MPELFTTTESLDDARQGMAVHLNMHSLLQS
jgi:hypothetical protein